MRVHTAFAGSVAVARVVLLLAVGLLVACVAHAAQDYPALAGRVVDEAEVLSPAERQSLESALAEQERKNGAQVVVVTLRSLRGTSIEDYGYQLGRHWRIGSEGKDDGVLFIIAPNERKVRIEVGYGLEGVLTDADSRIILERVVLPAFRSGQFGPGILAGTGAILKALAGEEPRAAPQRSVEQRRDEAFPWGLLILFVLFVCVMLMRRRGGGFRRGGGGIGGGPLGGSWRGGSGGGFSGGGFSGGGGSFGGGGASGSW